MTVAAVILATDPGAALREVEGVANARRLSDTAWAGGALPIVVVASDPDGALAVALGGSPAVLAVPAPRAGVAAQVVRGVDVARAEIEGTDAALVWPARMGWVDAETVTSLIEAHGLDRSAVVRPAFRGLPGWPALVPVVHLEGLRSAVADHGEEAELLDALAATGVPFRSVELGDPGATHDLATALAELPPFEGPPEPAAEHHHEWGSPAAAGPDEPPAPARTAG